MGRRRVGRAPQARAPGRPRPTSLTGPDDDRILNLVVQDATDVQLGGPTATRLPNGPATVTRVRAAVDDGAAFLDAVRRHVP